MSNNNYVIGRYVRIRRLLNQGDIKSGGTDTYLNIAEIQIYDDKKTKITVNDSMVSSSSIYGNDSSKWGKKFAVDDKEDVVGTTNFFHTAKDDNNGFIMIDLKNNYKISEIHIYKRPGYDRITNSVVQILSQNEDVISRTIITDSTINSAQISTNGNKIIIIPYVNNNCTPCQRKCPQCGIDYSTRCNTVFNSNNFSMISECLEKVKAINQNIDETNKLLTDLFTDQNQYQLDILKSSSDNINLLTIMNIELDKKVNQLPPVPLKLKITEPITEPFTNYKENKQKENNNISSSINSNTVYQYGKTLKDKQMEKFADFIQPKLNIYEKFGNTNTNTWKSDSESKKINFEYVAPSDNENENEAKIKSTIPIIKNPKIEDNLNNITSKILASHITRKSNLLINNWNQS